MKSTLFIVALIVVLAFTLSCGGNTDDPCPTSAQMSPQTASIDHLAVAPGNSQTFTVQRSLSGQCVVPPVVPTVTWTTSDQTNTTISNTSVTAQNTATAVVTCNHTATATVTATFGIGNTATGPSASATLTCR